MCIVIDTNTLSCIFNPNNANHKNFKPVLDWIKSGGRIIYGGEHYKKELMNSGYYKIVKLYRDKKQVIDLDMEYQGCVDKEEKKIESLGYSKQFDDMHIIAIILVSRCKIVCTKDKTFTTKFLKKKELYVKTKIKIPKVYSNSKNKDLLNKFCSNVKKCKKCKKQKRK